MASFTWTAGSGLWSDMANWGNAGVPGPADTASIAQLSQPFDAIFGPAAAATLTIGGDVVLAGGGTIGTLDATGFNNLVIPAGSALTVNTATLGDVVQIAGPGAGLSITGTATLDDANIGLYDGASLQLQTVASDFAFITLDATSTAEVGGGGIATPGTFAVDPGVTFAFSGQLNAPVLNEGTILVDNSSMEFGGPVTGTGEILAEDATVRLDSSVAAGITIALSGTGNALILPGGGTKHGQVQALGAAQIGPGLGSTDVAATITGFAPGNFIEATLPGITSAAYTAGTGDLGTVALRANGTLEQTITLAGDYTNAPFLLLPGPPGQNNTELVIGSGSIGTPAAAPSNPGSDAYSWNASGGDWEDAANWTDTTAGAQATIAPGANNAVTIANTTNLVPILNGDGNAASLTETGDFALNGDFAVGVLHVGVPGNFNFGTIDVLPGSVLTASSAVVIGSLLVDDSTAAISGLLTIGTFDSVVMALDGGLVTAGGLLVTSLGIVATDAQSTIEIGNAGGALAGALNIDAGASITAAFNSTIDAALVNNGIALFNGNANRFVDYVNGPVSGSGTLQINNFADLALGGGVAATQTIDFIGTEATLDLSGTGEMMASITGLQNTDEFLAAPSVTHAVFTPGAPDTGTLALLDAGNATVQSFRVSGSLTGNSFVVLPLPVITAEAGTGATEVLLAGGSLLAGAPPQPVSGSSIGESFTWNAGGGDWGTAANWTGDTATAPGVLDTVNLNNGSGFIPIISGAGNAAAVMENGGAVLSGAFNFGSLTIQQLANGYGWLDLAANTVLQAATASVLGGTLESVGATLTVSGMLSLGVGSGTNFFSSNLVAAEGAQVRVGALSLLGNVTSLQASYISVDASSVLEIGALGGAATGVLTVDSGSVVGGTNNLLRIRGNVANNGVINPGTSGGTIDGDVSGSGTLLLGSGDVLLVTGTIAASQTIAFTGPNATLEIANPTSAVITGFSPGDTIELTNVGYSQASYSQTGPDIGTLTLSDGTAETTLTLAGDYTGRSFIGLVSSSFGQDPTAVTLAAACFAAGTAIDTPEGPIAIEHLRIGDRVRTASGADVPVQWLGWRRTDCRRHPKPEDVWPVRVQAHAFGPGRPARTLYLSPDHAVHLTDAAGADMLVPIRYLINGASIAQEARDRVTYWHLELPRHDVVLAEGLPCESYLDTGNRAAFENGGAAIQVHPDFALRVWQTAACAPLVRTGARLVATRRRLLAQAEALGHTLTDVPDLHVLVDGRVLRPETSGRITRFRLPPTACRVRLVSRSAVPAQRGPASADHRRLGVAIARLALDGIELRLEDGRLSSGWHAPEAADGADAAADWRWTDGDAGLAIAGVRVLEVEVAMTERYWRTGADRRAAGSPTGIRSLPHRLGTTIPITIGAGNAGLDNNRSA